MSSSSPAPNNGPHVVNLMRKMHALENERKEVVEELEAWGALGFQDPSRKSRSNGGTEDFDLVAMWTESSETLQGVIADREAQLDVARTRSVAMPSCHSGYWAAVPD